ncbi:hypothetical protein R3P38DRAFT_2960067 [Favolaschia claudopus]|uniref:C2H2-type domain-containing protein n=1 Tax=Favolaschia claudopus TaxID=2862362 RepID=A0AAW0B983_9AGAR
MNIHTGIRPYGCRYPGCKSVFNVRSNARRHYNRHFYRPPPPPPPAPVEIRFAEPIVEEHPVPPPDSTSRAAFNVRWVGTNVTALGQSGGRRKNKSTAPEDAEGPEGEESSRPSRASRQDRPEDGSSRSA